MHSDNFVRARERSSKTMARIADRLTKGGGNFRGVCWHIGSIVARRYRIRDVAIRRCNAAIGCRSVRRIRLGEDG
jgi:hypothetical protein